MEQYRKPVMKIIELEELDILTKSLECPRGCETGNSKSKKKYSEELWLTHMGTLHQDWKTPDGSTLKAFFDKYAKTTESDDPNNPNDK